MRRMLVGLLIVLTLHALIGCAAMRFTDQTLLSDRDLVGYLVRDEAGESIGEVTSLIIDLDDGAIKYVVVALPLHPRSTVAQTLIPVPWSALRLDREAHVFVPDVSREVLGQAPRFDALPDTRQVGWDTVLRRYWNP